jgi:predicted Zn-dependent protease
MPVSIRPEPYEFDADRALALLRSEADWIGLRYHHECHHRRSARNGRIEHSEVSAERGVMVEVLVDGQIAYAGTSDWSDSGLAEAVRRAIRLAKASAHRGVCAFNTDVRPRQHGGYTSPRLLDLDSLCLEGFTARLLQACKQLQVSEKIVAAMAETDIVQSRMRYVSSNGSDIRQDFFIVGQHFAAVACDGCQDTQQRSLHGPSAVFRQSGLEAFDWDRIDAACVKAGEQAVALLEADNCPEEIVDLVLAPDQMLLQIHESVGHPLELDRILGDERNYAGWSFVRPADFGRLRYGSELMNVSFDPTLAGELAAYGYDDGGAPATREFLIRDGLLLRGIGGLESQARLSVPGTASFRATSWNRAPIDRMGNINLEPGDSNLVDMVGQVERGVYMETNRSWSIDDYRNKFQFGCEYARLIEDGRLTRVLKNPNYRGATLPFWASLQAVGSRDELQIFGTPHCGKGEPNQVIRVGHAAPPCLFRDVSVFGGGP